MRPGAGWLRILRRPFDLLFANLRLLAGVAAVPLVGETIVVYRSLRSFSRPRPAWILEIGR